MLNKFQIYLSIIPGATNKSSNPPPAYIQQSVNSLKKKRVQFPDDHSPESLSTDSTKKVLLDPNKNGQPMIDTPPGELQFYIYSFPAAPSLPNS